VIRVANLALALVGHIRGGLSQVVTVFSMMFSEMSGSTTADVAVISRALSGPMKKEGYKGPLSPPSSPPPRPLPPWSRPASPLWSTRGRQRFDRGPVHGRRGAGPQ